MRFFSEHRLNLLILPILLIFAFAAGCKERKAAANSFYSKNFTLMSLDNQEKEVNTVDFKGKPTVISFWASWCGPCREEMPNLEKSWRAYRDQGVQFVGINTMDKEKEAKEFLNQMGVSFLNLYDPNGKMANSYHVPGLPLTLFMDPSGKIVSKHFGGFIGEDGQKKLIENIEGIVQ